MTGDAVLEIAKLEREKKRIIWGIPTEPSDVYYIVQEDGELERVVGEHLNPSITCYSTEALLEVLGTDASVKAEIYYCADKVQAVLYDEPTVDRIMRHTLPLPLHPVFLLLDRLTHTRSFNQRDLIRFLRAELNGNVDDSVIEQFRHLNLKTEGEGSAVVDKGRVGVSRSLMQTIRTKENGNLDEIKVKVPVYDIVEMLTETFEVRVLVDCLPDAEGRPSFELTTVHSDLQLAKSSALEVIAKRLKAGVHPVIYGQAN